MRDSLEIYFGPYRDKYNIYVGVYNASGPNDLTLTVNKEELKDIRNSLHNLLIELNRELGYE